MRAGLAGLDRAASVAQLAATFHVSTQPFDTFPVASFIGNAQFSAAKLGPTMFNSERVFKANFNALASGGGAAGAVSVCAVM